MGLKKVSVGIAAMCCRRRDRGPAQYHLIDHEFPIISAVFHKFDEFGICDRSVCDSIILQQNLVPCELVVETKPIAGETYFVNSAFYFHFTAISDIGPFFEEKIVPVDREKRISAQC